MITYSATAIDTFEAYNYSLVARAILSRLDVDHGESIKR